MTPISSYNRIRHLGHPEIKDLMVGQIVIQEKVDGSQISFMVDSDGELSVKSKSTHIDLSNPKLFDVAIDVLDSKRNRLRAGWVYRGEYLRTVEVGDQLYGRLPADHIVIFDVMTGFQTFLEPALLKREAATIGLESTPLLYEGVGEMVSLKDLGSFLTRESFLGGRPIEGVVIKNYGKFGTDGKPLMGKLVSSGDRLDV